MNESEAHKAARKAGPRVRRLLAGGLIIGALGCARPVDPTPEDPIFKVSVVAVDQVRGTLVIEIENRASRPLHFPEPERWNYANLIKVGFRAFQPVIPTEAPRNVSEQQPNRDGDMMRVHWVLPLETELDVASSSRERRTFQVPEAIGGGRYSLALVVVARAQERWLTVEEPVLGKRSAGLPGSVRALAFVIFASLVLASAAFISLARPRDRSATT